MSNPFRHKAWHKPRSYYYFMGIPAVIGRLTDDDIAELYARYAAEGYSGEIFADICRTEKKTPAEVLEILHSRGLAKSLKKEDFSMSKPVFDPQVKEQIISEKLKGVPTKQLADETGLTPKQVENIYTAYKEKQKRQSKVDTPEPEVSADLPTVPVCEEEPSGCNVSEQDVSPVRVPVRLLNIFAVLLAMQEFVGTIAEGAEITEAAAAGTDAHISFSFGGNNYGLEMKRLDS